MNPLYNHYIIDMSSNNNFVLNPTMQGDGNSIRGIEIELIANGTQYVIDAENTIVAIMGSKPDTKQIMNKCEISDDGYILVDITSQMSAVKGRGDYSIVLMDMNTNSQLKSFPFHILTTPAPFNISEIVSSDEFQLLTKMIADSIISLNESNKQIDLMKDLNAQVLAEETVRISSENKRVTAENERKKNENNRKSAETAREDAEIKRQNNYDILMKTANDEVDRLKKENDTASNSAILAEQYKDSAEASANIATQKASDSSISALNAKSSEDNAKSSEMSSKDSADIATTKAKIASDSADSILDTEVKVTNKANDAYTYSNLSKSYAIGTDDEIRANDSSDNAKYYYEQAKGISEGLQGALLPMGTITFDKLDSQTKQAGYMYNISNSFTTTNKFKEGAGHKYSEGTNVYYTADGYWDCLTGAMVTSINGMKGDVTLPILDEITSNTEPTNQEEGGYWNYEY